MSYARFARGADDCGPPLHKLDGDDPAAGYFILQSSGQLVDVTGRDIYGSAFEHGNAAAADDVATNLDQESLHNTGIELLGGKPDEIAERTPDRQRSAIGPGAGHGVEGIGNAHDSN